MSTAKWNLKEAGGCIIEKIDGEAIKAGKDYNALLDGKAGKTVALFGCGDSESYPDTFCGGMKELYDAAVEAGATVLPGVSTDGYTYDDSEAIDGDKFLGLALDEVNEDDKTEERIDAWLEAIKPAL